MTTRRIRVKVRSSRPTDRLIPLDAHKYLYEPAWKVQRDAKGRTR